MSHQFCFHRTLCHKLVSVIVFSMLIFSAGEIKAQTFAWAKQIGGANSSTTIAMGLPN
jgi:hypothetical protein